MRVKLTNTQLNKLKFGAKNKTGATLRLTKKNFQDEEFPHEPFFFFFFRQATKMKNDFANNMSTDIKLSKSQLYKTVESGGSFDS